MLLLLRKALFYLLLIAYIFLTPAAIFYGLGYRFSPAEREILKTGVISMVTEPRGATVYLQARKFSEKTPTVIRGLKPGKYDLRITRKGFDAWHKSIEIEAEKATRFEPAILLPFHPKEEVIAERAFRDLLPAMGDFNLYALEGKNLAGLRRMDLLFHRMLLIETGISHRNDVLLDVHAKQDSSVVLFQINRQGKKGYLFFDLPREKILRDLTDQLPEEADWIDWNAKRPEMIYYLKNQRVVGIDLETGTEFLAAENVLGFHAAQRKLYLLKKDFSLWETEARGESPVLLSQQNFVPADIFAQTGARFYRVELFKREFFQKDVFLFLSNEGALLSNRPPYHLVKKGVKEICLTQQGDQEKFFYWTDHEIGVFDFGFNPEGDDKVFPPPRILYQDGKEIRNAFWAYENSHIVFQDRNQLFLLEADSTPPFLARSLAKTAPQTLGLYHERQRAIYYLRPSDSFLVKRKIAE